MSSLVHEGGSMKCEPEAARGTDEGPVEGVEATRGVVRGVGATRGTSWGARAACGTTSGSEVPTIDEG
jgi:hypothetical protein